MSTGTSLNLSVFVWVSQVGACLPGVYCATYLDFNRYDHGNQLLIEFPHHDQLLQSQAAQSAEGNGTRDVEFSPAGVSGFF